MASVRRNVELGHWTVGPSEPVGIGPWGDEIASAILAAAKDPQLRLLLGPQVVTLTKRMRDAPRRTKIFERVKATAIDPSPYLEAPEGHYLDALTGRVVVQEDDGSWFRELPHPQGAFTFGELARLHEELWRASERLADAAELLDLRQRKEAVEVVEAAEDLGRVLMLHQLDPATAERAKQTALALLALEQNPAPELSSRERTVLEMVHNGQRMTRAAAWKTTNALAEKGLVEVCWVPTKKGAKIGEHVPRITKAGERALARNPGSEKPGSFGIEAFGFDEPEERAPGLDEHLGEIPTALDATRLLKSTEFLTEPRISHYFRSRAWAVRVPARTDAEAVRIGKVIHKQLRSKRSLTASDPFLHDLAFYVVYDGGFVEVPVPRRNPGTRWGYLQRGR